MTEHPSSRYPREIPPTLLIEGDLLRALTRDEGGAAYVKSVRMMLVTGGRGLLEATPGRGHRGGVVMGAGSERTDLCIRLTPEIEHRIRTSGGTLTETEIATGMEQVREAGDDVQARITAELEEAYRTGKVYALKTLEIAMRDGNERALNKAWETARKCIHLVREINARAAA